MSLITSEAWLVDGGTFSKGAQVAWQTCRYSHNVIIVLQLRRHRLPVVQFGMVSTVEIG